MNAKNNLVFLVCLSFSFLSNSQTKSNEDFFVSEAATLPLNNNIIVSIKKYNPTDEQIKNAGSISKEGSMSYMQLPFEASHAELMSKEFESVLFCFDKAGNVLWKTQLGYSKSSSASPLAESKGFLYSGEGMKDETKVVIRKIDKDGKSVWMSKLDSLENLNSIYIFNNKVNALVSFDYSLRVDDPGTKTFSYKIFPIYHFVQLDIETGKVLKKEYQQMGNHLSSLGYSNPMINSDYAYFIRTEDSVAFLTIMNQKSASIVSEKPTTGFRILGLSADSASFHYLATVHDQNKTVLKLFTSYYEKDPIKYESQLPVVWLPSSRCLLLKTQKDSVVSVVNDEKDLSISFTDRSGKTTLFKKIQNPKRLLPLSVGIINDTPYIITVEGRDKPGKAGSIKIIF